MMKKYLRPRLIHSFTIELTNEQVDGYGSFVCLSFTNSTDQNRPRPLIKNENELTKIKAHLILNQRDVNVSKASNCNNVKSQAQVYLIHFFNNFLMLRSSLVMTSLV